MTSVTRQSGVMNPSQHPSHQRQEGLYDKYRDLHRPRKINFFVNGDRYFKGKKLFVTPNRYFNFNDLLNELTGKLPPNLHLPYGVRQIYDKNGGQRITDIDDLQDGQSYIAAGFEGYKSIKYGSAEMELWSVSKPQKNPHLDLSTDASQGNYRYRGYNNGFAPGKYFRTNGSMAATQRWPGKVGASSRNLSHSDSYASKPKVITIVRNGGEPRNNVKILLSQRGVQSFEQLINDISEAFTAKGRDKRVSKLYTVKGKQVQSVSDFFRRDDVFIGVGDEQFTANEAREIIHELYPDPAQAKRFMKSWFTHQKLREAKERELGTDKRDSGFIEPTESSYRESDPNIHESSNKAVKDSQDEDKTTSKIESKQQRRLRKFQESEQRALEDEKRKQRLVPLDPGNDPGKERVKAEEKRKSKSRQLRDRADEVRAEQRKKEEEKRRKELEEEDLRLKAEKAAAERRRAERRAMKKEREEREKEEQERAQREKEERERIDREKEEEEKREQENERDEEEIEKEIEEEIQRVEENSEVLDQTEKVMEDSERTNSREKTVEHNTARKSPEKTSEDTTDRKSPQKSIGEIKGRKTPDKTNGEMKGRKSPEKTIERDTVDKKSPTKDNTKVSVKEKEETDINKNEKNDKEKSAAKPKEQEKDKQKAHKPKLRVVRKTKFERQVSKDDHVTAKYDIGKILGDGNFAVVRQSKLKSSGQEVGIKIIDKSKLKGKEQMVENEIMIMKECNHQNIVKLYEEFESKEKLYLVMELVKGGDLFDAITQSVKFNEIEAAKMIHDLCNALFYLHSRNIVHRDLKPENLLVHVSRDGSISIKLADFGLAMEVQELIYTVCGTPTYVAPEILSEIGYSLEVDMWAVGVIMYILLCGFPPFRSPDRNQTELFSMIKAGEYEFISPYWDNTSNVAKNLIEHLLVVDRAKRYSSIDVISHPWVMYRGDMASLPDNQTIEKSRRECVHRMEKEALINFENYQKAKESRNRVRNEI